MSDAEAQIRRHKGESSVQVGQPKAAEHIRCLIITTDIRNGQVQVSGPVDHIDWCLEQLEKAKQEIILFNAARTN